jgi:hypothetical protein
MNTNVDMVLWELEGKNEFFDIADCKEPGYRTDKRYLLADLNNVSSEHQEILEQEFYLAFDDEWVTDGNGNCYRCQPDSYGWQPSFEIIDGEVVGVEDLVSDPIEFSKWIDENFVDLPDNAINNRLITDESLETVAERVKGDFENGWYGVNDDPKKILKFFQGTGREGLFFRVTGVSQFNMHFELWQLIYGRW